MQNKTKILKFPMNDMCSQFVFFPKLYSKIYKIHLFFSVQIKVCHSELILERIFLAATHQGIVLSKLNRIQFSNDGYGNSLQFRRLV